jgi:hypothetical protein
MSGRLERVCQFPTSMFHRDYQVVGENCTNTTIAGWFGQKHSIIKYTTVVHEIKNNIDKNNFKNPLEAKWECSGKPMLPLIGFLKKNNSNQVLVPGYIMNNDYIIFYNQYRTLYAQFEEDVKRVLKGSQAIHTLRGDQIKPTIEGGRSRRTRRRYFSNY